MTVEKGGGEHWIATGIWTLSRRPGSTLHKPEQKVQEIQPFDPGEDSGDMAGTHGPEAHRAKVVRPNCSVLFGNRLCQGTKHKEQKDPYGLCKYIADMPSHPYHHRSGVLLLPSIPLSPEPLTVWKRFDL
jgi:hypothetical protein